MNDGNFNDYDNDSNSPYNIFKNGGRQKNNGFSIASLVCSLVSVFLSFFGWVGLILGVLGILFSILARRELGYFNGFAIAGLIVGIFGVVFSSSMIIVSYVNPDFFKKFVLDMTLPSDGTPTTPSTGNQT